MFPSNLTAYQNQNSTKTQDIYRNTKYAASKKGKIHHVWHPIKYYKHTKKQENETHNGEINWYIQTNPKLSQMLELANKNLETVIKLYFKCSKS